MIGQECNHWMHFGCARTSAQKAASSLGDGRTFFSSSNPNEYMGPSPCSRRISRAASAFELWSVGPAELETGCTQSETFARSYTDYGTRNQKAAGEESYVARKPSVVPRACV